MDVILLRLATTTLKFFQPKAASAQSRTAFLKSCMIGDKDLVFQGEVESSFTQNQEL